MQEKIPVFLEEMLEQNYGKALVEKIKVGYPKIRPVTFRVNTLKASKQEIAKVLEKEKISYQNIDWYEDAFLLTEAKEDAIQKLEIYENGKIYLQSLSSMMPPIVLQPKENENILDMAAAPGGKTTQIAALSNQEAMITACEKNQIRLERLKYNLNKQGATRVNVMKQDARNLDEFFSFDKILLDAPCSGSGTREVLGNHFTKELIQKSVKVQKELLKKALKIVRVGGEIVYSTCSILKEENEEVVEEILKTKAAEILPISSEIFQGAECLPTSIKGTICILPNREYEGFFISKIKRIK